MLCRLCLRLPSEDEGRQWQTYLTPPANLPYGRAIGAHRRSGMCRFACRNVPEGTLFRLVRGNPAARPCACSACWPPAAPYLECRQSAGNWQKITTNACACRRRVRLPGWTMTATKLYRNPAGFGPRRGRIIKDRGLPLSPYALQNHCPCRGRILNRIRR